MSKPCLLFVVEARRSSESDWMYLRSVILFYYGIRCYRGKTIFAKTKSLLTYEKKIYEENEKFDGKAKVIIIADVDENDDEQNHKIERRCKEKGYELVWMNMDVEDVFWGKRIDDKKKAKEAIKFQRMGDKALESLGVDILMEPNPLKKRHSSNLLLVLDKYLPRK